MSQYPSAQALLEDARLRMNSLGSTHGMLVVEGPDDKRVFANHLKSTAQVVVSGGRRPLLAAYHAASQHDLQRIAFVTDCDFEVGLGTLKPGPSLIITKHADVEADLLELGLFKKIAVELIPQALNIETDADHIASQLQDRSVEFAATLGQLRQVAKQRGVEIDLDDLKYRKVRDSQKHVNHKLLITKVGQQLDYCDMPMMEFIAQVERMPNTYSHCNGHDLINALHFILREDFNVTVERRELARIIRALSAPVIPEWTVSKRLRKWESTRNILLFRTDTSS